jgi:hypothetical protein
MSKISKLSSKRKGKVDSSELTDNLPNLTTESLAGNSDSSESESDTDESTDLKQTIKHELHKKSVLEPIISTMLNGILNDKTLFDSLVEAVYTAVSTRIREQRVDDIKQEVHDSVSMDILNNKSEISDLKTEIDHLKENNYTLQHQIEEAEQYSRRNCLLLHGVPEQNKEDTTITAINEISSRLGIPIKADHIDRSHRLGKPKIMPPSDSDNKPNPRPIIIKFVSYSQRAAVYLVKSKLKKTHLLITESLTTTRMEIYRKALALRKAGLIETVWSQDGRIFIINNQEKRLTISKVANLDSF